MADAAAIRAVEPWIPARPRAAARADAAAIRAVAPSIPARPRATTRAVAAATPAAGVAIRGDAVRTRAMAMTNRARAAAIPAAAAATRGAEARRDSDGPAQQAPARWGDGMADGRAESHAFIAGLELADSRGGDLEPSRGGDSPVQSLQGAPAIPFDTTQQAVAAGSQLIEFDASVAPELRSAVTNVMLLAQLAANKAAADGPIEAWYSKYSEVLARLGWVTADLARKEDSFDGSGVDVQQAILGVLTVALGPGAAAASILAAAVGALGKTADSSGWIDLFEQASRHTSFTSVQLSYGSAA